MRFKKKLTNISFWFISSTTYIFICRLFDKISTKQIFVLFDIEEKVQAGFFVWITLNRICACSQNNYVIAWIRFPLKLYPQSRFFCSLLIYYRILVSLKNKRMLCNKGFVLKFNIWIGRKLSILNRIWNQGSDIWPRGNNFCSFKAPLCLC